MIEIGAFYAQILKGVTEKGLTIDEAISECSKNGIKWADVGVKFLHEEGAEVIADRLKRNGMGIISVHSGVVTDVSSEEAFLASLESGKRDMDLAKQAGSKYFMIVPQKTKPFDESLTDAFFAGARRLVGELCEYGKKIGLQVTVENFSKREMPYSTIRDMEWFFENIDGLRFTLDSGNFTLAGCQEYIGARLFFDKAVYAHLKDFVETDKETNAFRDGIYYDRVPMFDGMVRNADIIKYYVKNGFDGVFTVEYSGDNVFDTTILGAKRIIELLEAIKAGKA